MKKQKSRIFILAAILTLVLALSITGCTPSDPPSDPEEVYYTITFDLDGGEISGQDLSAGLKVKEGTALTLADYTPTKSGYTFRGWSADGVAVTEDTYTVTKNVTLTANWDLTVIPTYTVIFDLDGGEIPGQDLSAGLKVKEGTALALSDYTPTKSGYTFRGWSADGAAVTEDTYTVTKNVTLTANWNLIVIPTYTVTFDPDGGTMDDTAVTVNEGDTITLSDYVPVRTGFIFAGWIDENGEPVTDTSVAVHSDMTLKASWRVAYTDTSEFVFTLSEDGTYYILSDLADDFHTENVVVPGMYNGKPVKEIGYNAFSYNDTLKTIDLTNCTSLELIGGWNFAMCDNLVSVDLGGLSSLRKIETACFYASTALRKINLKGLTGLESIGSSCFHGYSDATAVPVEELDFSECTSLTFIDQMSLWYLTEIKVLDFSNTKISHFERQTIKECPKLEIVSLPATLKLDENTSEFLSGECSLKEIRVHPLNIYITSEDGVLYDIEKTMLFKYPCKSEAKSYVAPATLRRICAQAFYGAENLESINLCDAKITVIGWAAFSGCSAATVKVGFGRNAAYSDGTAVSLGTGWSNNTVRVAYATVFVFDIEGIEDNLSTPKGTVEVRISAQYGSADCEISVTVNGTPVIGADGVYTLSLSLGQNIIEITAKSGDNTASRVLHIEHFEGSPEIETTVVDGKVYYGSTVEFTITAKKADGTAIGKDGITIKTNWGYGLNDLNPMAYTMTDNDDGTVSVSIDFDTLWGMMFYEGGEFTLEITAKDGEQSAKATYKIEHREGEAPDPTVTTTVVDGKVYYGSTVDFTITAKKADGTAIGKDGITIKTNWGYGLNDLTTMAYTMTDNDDGTVSVSIDFDMLWGMMFYEGGEFTLEITAKDGEQSAKATYKIEHREGEAPAPTVTTTVTDGKVYSGSTVDFTITAKKADGTAIGKDGITIKTNWGYGLNDLTTMAYTMTDNDDGTVSVSIDFDTLWNMMFYEGGEFTLEITAKDGEQSAKATYKIEHVQE